MEDVLVKEKSSDYCFSFVSVRMQGTREESGLKEKLEDEDGTSIWIKVLG